MRLIGDLLGEVLANTAKLVAEREKAIRGQGGVPGEVRDQQRSEKVAIEGTRESDRCRERLKGRTDCPADNARPIKARSLPKTAKAELFCEAGTHENATAPMQARIGTARTETEIQ